MTAAVSTAVTRTEDAFAAWLASAKPGAWCTYHVGPHATGAACEPALKAYDAKLVTLAQRRLDGRDFEYMARRLAPNKGRR